MAALRWLVVVDADSAVVWLPAAVLVLLTALLVAVYRFASSGPPSFHAQWRDLATQALADAGSGPTSLVTEHDLAALPAPLAAYVRRSGAVGKPRVTSVCAHFHGRIRSGPG